MCAGLLRLVCAARMLCKVPEVTVGFLILILSSLAASAGFVDVGPLNYWALTRQSAVVVWGTVTTVDTDVTIKVARVLKGSEALTTVAFPCPPIPDIPHGVEIRHGPRVLKFAVGESWLVFLQTSQSASYILLDAVSGNTTAGEQAIRDVLELDSLTDGRAKCSLLVRLVNSAQGISVGLAARELDTFNTPEYLDLFAGLVENNAFARRTYVRLLAENISPKTLPILRGLLKTADRELLPSVVDALARKDVKSVELSEELLGLIGHDNLAVRGRVILALEYRDYFEAFPRIVECLDDPDPSIRAVALSWPWYAYVRKHPEVLVRIRKLARDPHELVRSSACRALIGARDLASFYRLWFMSVFDRSKSVRDEVRLDLLLEHDPLACATLLLWPFLVSVVAAWLVARRLSRKSRISTIVVGICGGYVVGLFGGWLIGTYRATNPLVHALFLVPAVSVPFVVLLCAVGRSLVQRAVGQPRL